MRNKAIRALSIKILFGAALAAVNVAARATDTLEVPGVELYYMSGLPENHDATARVRLLDARFRKYLAQYGYSLAPPLNDPDVKVQVASGYLFHHSDVAAALARQAGAGWMVLAHLVQPTSLWAEFNVQLVEAATGRIRADYDVELKGPVNDGKDTDRAAERMVQKLDGFLKRFAEAQSGSAGVPAKGD